ncbi:MAG: tRNA (adenine(22)-N(1))-methyltransferase [Desulfotomaculales bacterium]
MPLPPRLKAIAELVPPGRVVADIGTDHALLPVYLVQNGRCPKVIATELNRGPAARASSQVGLHGLGDRIEIRLGEGLAPLSPGEVQAVVVAGLGGGTVREVLSASPEILKTLERLVLQPMNDVPGVRRWLVQNGWRLADEVLVAENGRLYVVIAAEQGKEEAGEKEWLLEIGPRLWEKRDPLLKDYLLQLKKNYQRILCSLAGSRSPEAEKKALQLTARLARVREALQEYDCQSQGNFPAGGGACPAGTGGGMGQPRNSGGRPRKRGEDGPFGPGR